MTSLLARGSAQHPRPTVTSHACSQGMTRAGRPPILASTPLGCASAASGPANECGRGGRNRQWRARVGDAIPSRVTELACSQGNLRAARRVESGRREIRGGLAHEMERAVPSPDRHESCAQPGHDPRRPHSDARFDSTRLRLRGFGSRERMRERRKKQTVASASGRRHSKPRHEACVQPGQPPRRAASREREARNLWRTRTRDGARNTLARPSRVMRAARAWPAPADLRCSLRLH